MADGTKIEWTASPDGTPGATWNIITGCSVISPGCASCYAMRLAGTRLQHHPSREGLTKPSKAGPVWTGDVRFNAQWLDQPLRWTKPRKIFVAAHGDLFHEAVPDAWIDQVFAVMALAPQHTFQVLTKRAERMRLYMNNSETIQRIYTDVCDLAVERNVNATLVADPSHAACAPPGPRVFLGKWPLPNIHLGVSVEDQQRANERIPHLLATPAAVRWISAEPLLGPVDLTRVVLLPREAPAPDVSVNALSGWWGGYRKDAPTALDWVVVGGESGPGARDMVPEWARSLRDQCGSAGVPFFMKQMARKAAIPADLLIREMPA